MTNTDQAIASLATPALREEYRKATDKYLVAEYAIDSLDLPRGKYEEAVEILETILEA